jgi:electron transport complex protein RnfG
MASIKRAGPLRLIITLGIAGFFSGLVLVTVFLATQPLILRNQAEALEAAIYRVLPGSTTQKPFVLEEGALVPFEEEGGRVPLQDAVFGAYDDNGQLVGFGIPSEGPGFQDTIKLIYGFDVENENIVGMEVLESKETPGLGDKIIKDQDFLDSFKALSVEPEVLAVKPGESQSSNEVDTISGATISSKAVIKIINEGNRRWLDLVSQIGESEEKP